MIKLIASDLDGTMFEKGNVIPETNLKAINDINNSNINFTICTGKTYSLFKNICQDIGTGYGIFGNGNQIINLKTGEEIYRKLLKNEDVLFCINTAKKLNLHVHLYTNKEVITEKLLYMDLRNFELTKNDKNIDLEYEYLDIMPAGINKEQALEVLENYLKIDKSEVLAIGDNLNDLEMIKDSGVGIAVANAYDEVKEVANYTTTTTAQNGGFAEAVYKFIEFK